MDKVQEICSAVLAIRNNQNIKTRTPLRELQIRGRNVMHLQSFAELIKDEVNVKQIQFAESIGEEATLKLQLNFSVLGKRLPNKMKDILSAVKTGNWQLQGHSVEVLGEKLMEEEYEIILEPKHKTNSQALPTNDALVILDLTITEELRREGLARDLVRIIQQARKDTQLDIADRIILSFTMDEGLRDALKPYVDYIQEQTLSEIKDTRVESSNYTYIKEEELGDKPIVIGFSKVNS
jgi:isoleucyl-tRNA synthetase